MVNHSEIALKLGKCLVQGRNHCELCDFSGYLQVIASRLYNSNEAESMDGNF